MIIDLVFPRYDEEFADNSGYLSTAFIQKLRPWKKKVSAQWYEVIEGIWVFSVLGDPYIKELVYRFKLGEYSIGESLAGLLKFHIENDSAGFIPPADLITFVPHDPKRFVERGFHPPEKIAHSLGKMYNIRVETVVTKLFTTYPQAQLSKKERLKSLNGAFGVTTAKTDELRLHNSEIIWLIDDIVTTGTTLFQTAKAIKKQYPFLKIYCLAVSSN